MANPLKRSLRRFFRKSNQVNNEPINKVSLVVIILIDLFILTNVFWGLQDVGSWPISPQQEHPCYSEWVAYRQQTNEDKAFEFLQSALMRSQTELPLQERYRTISAEHLGQVSASCTTYAEHYDRVDTAANQQRLTAINQRESEIATLEAANRQIREQYDSTLLESLAGQPQELSINEVEASQAKQELDRNTAQIATLRSEIEALKAEVVNDADSQPILSLLMDEAEFTQLEQQYDRATFWHPTIQIFFQGLFLLPLLAIAGAVHQLAQRRNYGLVALLSWHLLVIFTVPLIVKLFQILQVGALFSVLTDLAILLLGGLQFLVSYLYILLIPLVGFGLIKFFQKVVFNPKVQAAGRVQKGRCIRCAKKLHHAETHCPHCGYGQLRECPTCHASTYRLLPHCRACGAKLT
ncbi:membrane protein [Leptolyngbya iicbica]|uniref:Zinc ribbon domain-containing protein n=2 Tax=Cyanophyceae TaxID=3028117 RepID=A0A4Q7EA67_9CYAN|nr:membrane protein [Leptolyngbya sp. LK]RZM79344.1 hypothetical protein DYY88_11395 [Leptolyngbya sp. LK]